MLVKSQKLLIVTSAIVSSCIASSQVKSSQGVRLSLQESNVADGQYTWDVYKLEVPKGTLSPVKVANAMKIFAMEPQILDEFLANRMTPTKLAVDKSKCANNSANVFCDDKVLKLTHEELSDSDDEELSPDTLYMSLESAWMDLNDFSKSENSAYYRSALSSVIAYIANGGNKDEATFKKLLGRICYEPPEDLQPKEKEALGVQQIGDIKMHGLSLLREVAKVDSEAEDYLTINGL